MEYHHPEASPPRPGNGKPASPLSTRPRRGHQAPHAYYCRSAHDATVNARLKVLSYNVCFIKFAPAAQYRLLDSVPPAATGRGRREGDVGTPARPSRSAQRNNARTLKGAGRRQAPRPRSASSMADRYMTANFELTERRSGAIGYSVRAYLSGSIPRIKKGIPIVSAGLGGARRAYRQWYFLGIPMPSRPLSQGR